VPIGRGGRDTDSDGGPSQGTSLSQTPNTTILYHGRQSAWDKLRGREGNNPDHRLRSRSTTQSLRKLVC
jgi:hypothetical protein